MKKLLYILSFISLSIALFSCDQKIDFPFQGKSRVQIKCYDKTTTNNTMVYFDSVAVSLGLLDDDILEDTLRVPIELLGYVSDVDRIYKVVVDKDSTNAIEGVHYKAFENLRTLKAGKIADTLKIVILRENLSTSFRNPVNFRLELKLEATEDFDLGLTKGLRMKYVLNNYLSEPIWWGKKGPWMGYLNYYHPKKWKILISFNDKFANFAASPFGYNDADGKVYLNGLKKYLTDIVVLDDETGQRVKMDELEPIQ